MTMTTKKMPGKKESVELEEKEKRREEKKVQGDR